MRVGWLVIRALKVVIRVEVKVKMFVEGCWIPKMEVTIGVSVGSFVPHIVYMNVVFFYLFVVRSRCWLLVILGVRVNTPSSSQYL